MLKKVTNIGPFTQICTKSPPSKFRQNPFSSCSVILLTNQPNFQQMDTGEKHNNVDNSKKW